MDTHHRRDQRTILAACFFQKSPTNSDENPQQKGTVGVHDFPKRKAQWVSTIFLPDLSTIFLRIPPQGGCPRFLSGCPRFFLPRFLQGGCPRFPRIPPQGGCPRFLLSKAGVQDFSTISHDIAIVVGVHDYVHDYGEDPRLPSCSRCCASLLYDACFNMRICLCPKHEFWSPGGGE